MRIKSRKCTTYFWLSFVALLFLPVFFPNLRLLYFAPYIVVSLYQHPQRAFLIRAALAGVLFDLFSSSTLFGMTSWNYCLTGFILYGQKHNFFEDKLSTLPLMCLLFSLISSLCSVFFAFFLDHTVTLSFRWLLTDWIGMSLLDGVYGLLLSLFFQLTRKIIKITINDSIR